MQMVSKNVLLCLSACLSACLSETNFERKLLQSLTLLFTAIIYTAVIYTAVVHANISVNDGSGISCSTLNCCSLQRCCLHCTAIVSLFFYAPLFGVFLDFETTLFYFVVVVG